MPSFDYKVNTIVDFIKPGDVVLFVGSGASTDAHLSGWDIIKSKLREVLTSYGFSTKDLDVFEVADLAKAKCKSEYYRILRQAFRDPLVEPGELDELLASLRLYFKFVLTSNYDKLLETAFRTVRLGIDPPVTTELDIAKALHGRGEFFVYKFNGDIDDEQSIVLGQKDYARSDYNGLFSFLSSFKVLYVTYGFRDRILEQYRTGAIVKNKWKQNVLIMMNEGERAKYLSDIGNRVITFSDFEEQKRMLQQVSTSLIENPFKDVHRIVFMPATEVATDRLFANVRDSVRAVTGRMLILHENWEFGWDADDFRFKRIGTYELPMEAQMIVDQYTYEIDRPWWGKLAYMGLVLPLTERKGVIYGANTSYRKYMLLWKKLDEEGLLPDSTLREKFWQFDIKKQFEGSDLPHILCMHLAVVSSDGKLLLTRKSDKVAFEGKNWCPSIEEQVSDGNGEASQDEIQELISKTGNSKPVDESPKAACLRGLDEELRIPREWVTSIRFYAFCTDWRYSDVDIIGVVFLNVKSSEVNAKFGGEDVGEFQVDPKRWIQYNWTPARVDNIARLLGSLKFGNSPELRGDWHVSAKLRLFAVMAAMVQRKWATWAEWREAIHGAATSPNSG